MLVVCGEAIIDLVADSTRQAGYRASPGGSPFNVAVCAARLGLPTALMARLGSGEFGRLLRSHAAESQLDLSLSVISSAPPALAVVSPNPDGVPTYEFYLDGTAEAGWQRSELPGRLPDPIHALHVGSIASWRAPAANVIAELVRRERDRNHVLISFDPNLRSQLMADADPIRTRVERLVTMAHLVKVSTEDLHCLYPDEDPDAASSRWAQRGPGLVVRTDGANDMHAYRPGRRPRRLPVPNFPVVDTVGGGDAFAGGLLVALAERGRLGLSGLDSLVDAELDGILISSGLVAGLTCTRVGADPPWLEVRDAFAAQLAP